MRVTVTGGRGFIGARLVRQLLADGHEVRSFDNASRGDAQLPPDVESLEGDVRDLEAVRAACTGAEAVVHLAAVQGTGNFYELPDLVLDVNLRGVLNVAEACAETGVSRLVFSSSSEVYAVPETFPTREDAPLVVPDPTNPRWSYGGSKIAGELVVVNFARRYRFEHVILRYHNVYGPAMGRDHVIPQFIERLGRGEEFTVQGDGEQRRSFCFVDDAVDPTAEAVTRREAANGIFNIGNPDEEHTINEVVAALGRVTGRRIEPRYVDAPAGGTSRRLPDVSAARTALGLAPRVPLEDGLRETVAGYAPRLLEPFG